MRIQGKIIGVSVFCGLLAWGMDAAIDWAVFYDGTLLELMLTDVPSHEIYARSVFLLFCLVCGFVLGRLMQGRERAREKLKRSELKFRRSFESAPDPAFLLDSAGTFRAMNDAAVQRLKYSREEVLGKAIPDIPFFTSETVEKTTRNFKRRKQGEDIPPYVVSCHDRSGELVMAELNVAEFVVEGVFEGEIVTARDVTEREQAMQRARELNAILKAIQNINQVILHERDRDSLLQAACEELVRTRSYEQCAIELEEEGSVQVVARAGGQVQRRDETGTPVCCAGESGWSAVFPMVVTDETTGALCVRLESREALDEEERGLLEEVANDLAMACAKIRTEEKLRTSEERIRSLYESMSEGMCVHKLVRDESGEPIDYRILDCNPSYEEITGLKKSDVAGKLASDVYTPDEAPFLDTYAEVVETGVSKRFEVEYAPLGLELAISVFRPAPEHFATVFTDISERRRRQAALKEKTREMERFTYAVSHDLKSPLITIEGFTGSMKRDLESGNHGRMKADLERVEGAAQHMRKLLDDLLDLSRAGRLEQDPREVPMGDLVDDVLGALNGPISEENAEVKVEPHMPAVEVDPARIKQVLQNLIENSLKFAASETRTRIEVGCRKEGKENIFFVKDNGQGIEADQESAIFEMFKQLEPGAGGTGMGLAVVKRIVESHGGRIWVDTTGKDDGACFCFTVSDGRRSPDPEVNEKS